jgi:hypothetical protein
VKKEKMIKEKIKKHKKLVLGSTMFTLILVGFVVAVFVAPSTVFTVLTPDEFVVPRSWRNVALGADANPGSEESGIINVYIYPHQADTSTYNSALSEATAFAHFDASAELDRALEGTVPYDTAFDIAITVQYNYTVAYNTTSSSWDKDHVRTLITCAGLSIGADTEMTKGDFFDSNAGEDTKITFYLNNGGSGYSVGHGQTINATSVKVQGYW